MAVNLGQLVASVSEKVIGEKPTDNVFTSQTLLAMLKEHGGFKQVDGGRLIECGVIYQENSTFKSYSDLETLDTARQDFIDVARYEWKEIGGTSVISELELARAQGESAKYDLAATKAQHAKDSLFAVCNRQMWSDGTGNGSKDIGASSSWWPRPRPAARSARSTAPPSRSGGTTRPAARRRARPTTTCAAPCGPCTTSCLRSASA